MRHICARFFAAVAFAGLLAAPATTYAQAHPSNAKFRGLTHGEWLGAAWQAALAIPIEGGSHPWINGGAFVVGDRMVAPSAPVIPLGSPKVTIPITVSPGTPLFVGIIGVSCSVAEAWPFHGEDEAELRACANGLLDLVQAPYVEIDGKPVTDPGAYRTESPLFRYGPLPANNYLGLPPGTQSDAVVAGYGLLVSPLSAGVHRIAVSANVPAVGIAVDAEFIITVVPLRRK
jgi:hypothetical protein